MSRKERGATRVQGGRSGSMGAADVAQAYEQAVRHLQNNQIEPAEFLCRMVLGSDPHHAGCLHLLGAIALQAGQAAVAADLIGKAIASRKNVARYHDDLGFALHALGKVADAIESHKRAIRLDPDNTQLHLNLANKLLAAGNRDEAATHFIKAMELTPEMFHAWYSKIKALLFTTSPAFEDAATRASAAWPRRLSIEELLGGGGFRALSDRTLTFVLASAPVRDAALEKLLTSIRYSVLQHAVHAESDKTDQDLLEFCCALARQCFLNEYVFDATADEEQAAERLKNDLGAAIEANAAIPPIWIAAVGSYFPLEAVGGAAGLLKRGWPRAVEDLLTQQLREPAEEREIAQTIPNLSPIASGTSQLVRQQYEENPYPRWVLQPYAKLKQTPLDQYIKTRFPGSFVLDRRASTTDILIAGCGTGRHPMIVTKMFAGAKIQAIDLSLASMSYARRQMRKFGVTNISFAQADILTLGALGRTFDLVDTTGVLHHLADPMEGLRALVSLVRPRGFLRIGLYSELARRDVVAAREYCATRSYQPTARDIRSARQDLRTSPFCSVERFTDFFCVSECRDLLFHVQEHRFTIAQLKQLLATHSLTFIGFELIDAVRAVYRSRFPGDPAMQQLDNWETFESENPDTFTNMYEFWVQTS